MVFRRDRIESKVSFLSIKQNLNHNIVNHSNLRCYWLCFYCNQQSSSAFGHSAIENWTWRWWMWSSRHLSELNELKLMWERERERQQEWVVKKCCSFELVDGKRERDWKTPSWNVFGFATFQFSRNDMLRLTCNGQTQHKSLHSPHAFYYATIIE